MIESRWWPTENYTFEAECHEAYWASLKTEINRIALLSLIPEEF